MAPALKTALTGSATFAVGLALWLSNLDQQILFFTPTKVGVVLMVIGALEALYGLYKTTRPDS